MSARLSATHRGWRGKVFTATLLSYAGFYFTRKPFSATKAAIDAETGWGATTLGNIWAAYLVTYALGHFLAAAMGTKLGPRRNLLLGMTISVVVTGLLGSTLSIPLMAALMAVHGLAQATGWSGNVGTLAAWFRKAERGRVMAIWSNLFSVGALGSGWVMAWILDQHAAAAPAPWRNCFFFGGGVLAVVIVLFVFLQRNRPEDVGLEPIDDPDEPTERLDRDRPPATFSGLSRNAWTNLGLVAAFYFFAKFIRYAIWSWAAYFLQKNFGLTGARANVYATIFDVMGIPGVYLTGWLSDRLFASRRAEVSLLMMIAMTVTTTLLVLFGSTSVGVFAILLGLAGLTLYGPDTLLTGAGAMDIGSRRSATFAAATISGFGSLGAIVQELVIARTYDGQHGALGPIFLLLFGSALLATVFCALLAARNRAGQGI